MNKNITHVPPLTVMIPNNSLSYREQEVENNTGPHLYDSIRAPVTVTVHIRNSFLTFYVSLLYSWTDLCLRALSCSSDNLVLYLSQ